MSRRPLTSRSPRRLAAAPAAASPAPPATAAAPQTKARPAWRGRLADPRLWGSAGLLLGAMLVAAWVALRPPGLPLTQDDIDRAVRASLEAEPLPSAYAAAYAAIVPSVVRVAGLQDDTDTGDGKGEERALARTLGTGVVIVDTGIILTNLHVVSGAKRIRLRFADGSESDADLIGSQPENDLAVLRAHTIPDDLPAATLRSTGDLLPGDQVIAVGHPFGVGPSASAGVVSGLQREFRTPEGRRELSNLIQFDAAANPGNSGGPLVTMDGHVVGIVTAILNPSEQRTFIGIGFAVPIENAAAAAGMPPF